MVEQELGVMKICIISGSYPPIQCGIGDYVQQLARGLAEKDVHVDILTSTGKIDSVPDQGVTIYPRVNAWNLSALPSILSHLRKLRPDIVNIQYPTQKYGRQPFVNVLPLFIRAGAGIPVITTVHEFNTYRRLGRLRVGLSVFTSNRVIVPDRRNLNEINRSWPSSSPRLHHVPLGANIEPQGGPDIDRARQREGYGVGPSDIICAYFGFISPSKGVETLLKAFRLAVDARPNPPIRLLLIASRHPSDPQYTSYHQRVEAILRELNLAEHVYWTDYLPPAGVSAMLASADMAVLPFLDGASLRRTTLLSALAHGLPVISTMVDQDPQYREIAETNAIHLVPVGDAQALANAILTLAMNRQKRLELAANGVLFAKALSWPNIAGKILDVYRLALGG